jgi:hypothetical protein
MIILAGWAFVAPVPALHLAEPLSEAERVGCMHRRDRGDELEELKR